MKQAEVREEEEEEPLVLTRRTLRRQSMRVVSQTGMVQAHLLGKLDGDRQISLTRSRLNHFTDEKGMPSISSDNSKAAQTKQTAQSASAQSAQNLLPTTIQSPQHEELVHRPTKEDTRSSVSTAENQINAAEENAEADYIPDPDPELGETVLDTGFASIDEQGWGSQKRLASESPEPGSYGVSNEEKHFSRGVVKTKRRFLRVIRSESEPSGEDTKAGGSCAVGSGGDQGCSSERGTQLGDATKSWHSGSERLEQGPRRRRRATGRRRKKRQSRAGHEFSDSGLNSAEPTEVILVEDSDRVKSLSEDDSTSESSFFSGTDDERDRGWSRGRGRGRGRGRDSASASDSRSSDSDSASASDSRSSDSDSDSDSRSRDSDNRSSSRDSDSASDRGRDHGSDSDGSNSDSVSETESVFHRFPRGGSLRGGSRPMLRDLATPFVRCQYCNRLWMLGGAKHVCTGVAPVRFRVEKQ